MKNLIVYSHPNPKSFCYGILETITQTLKAKGHEVILRDLYTQKFDPVLKGSDFESFAAGKMPTDILIEQNHIRWAERMIFIYPVWWAGFPAIMKGYVDRVYTNGFAFKYGASGPEGLLGGKKSLLIGTLGSPLKAYEDSGMAKSIRQTINGGVFQFCGMEVAEHLLFGAVTMSDETTRKKYLSEASAAVQKLNS